MKNDVLEFLAAPTGKPQEQFNKALELYRKSKKYDESQLRFFNRLGFAPARLNDLLYELKKLHNISDLELATARNKAKKDAVKVSAEDERIEGSIKLVVATLDEIDPEKMDLKDLEEAEAILAKEFDNIPQEKQSEEIKEKLDKFYEVLNKKHFETEEAKKAISQNDNADDVKQLEVDSPEEVNADDQDKTSEKETPEAEVEKKEAPEVEAEKKETVEAGEEETPENATDADSDPEELQKAAEAEKAEFLKNDLGGFDVAGETYNNTKSFAAVLSDYINENPKDQKWDTLKDFISEAKKKHSAA